MTLYRVGTTSVIVKTRSTVMGNHDLALKCVLWPYTAVDAIAEATASYAVDSADTCGKDGLVTVQASRSKWILMDFVNGWTLEEIVTPAAREPTLEGGLAGVASTGVVYGLVFR